MVSPEIKTVSIYSDGASRGNPGPAAYGYVFVRGNEVIYRDSGYLGNKTNNQAEYHGALESLKKANKKGLFNINYFSDSNLLINQLNGEWQVRDKELKKLHKKVREVIEDMELDFTHVNRENEFIEIADSLCNQELNSR